VPDQPAPDESRPGLPGADQPRPGQRGPDAAVGAAEITVDGAAWQVPAGTTIAAAFTGHGQPAWRRTRLRGDPRGLSCGIGVCFDCLVTVNGTPGVRACLAEARPGDVISAETGSGFTAEPPGLPGREPVAGPAPGPEPGPGRRGRQDTGHHPGGGTAAAGPRAGAQPPAAGRGPELASCDVAIIGAGPAGLTAAVAAADSGCTVQVLDLGERPGGQYWRWGPATADGRFHHGWAAFTQLRDRFAAHQASGRISYRPGHAVFQVEPPLRAAGSEAATAGAPVAGTGTAAASATGAVTPDGDTPATGAAAPGAGAGPAGPAEASFRIHAVNGDRERGYTGVQARAVVVATGAYDLQLPVPGWTLPGVMAAGAAQAMLKSSGVAAGRRIVVAGTGPFLLPVAAGLAEAGARVVAVAEAGQPLDYLRYPPRLARSWRKLPEAGGYLSVLARHRIPVLRRHAAIAAHGDGRLESVTLARLDRQWRPVAGTERVVAADVLAAGYGFMPQVELLGEAGAELASTALTSAGLAGRGLTRRGSPGQPTAGADAAVAVVAPDQQTTVPGLFAAGETTGVGGADLARIEGEIAGRAAARYTGRAVAPPARAIVAGRGALRQFAAVMHTVHAVQPGWASWPGEDTIVCRCEEVTLGRMRGAAGLGADDARSIKLLARPGMGWCQGRICGPVVDALLAAGLDPVPAGPAGPGAGSAEPAAADPARASAAGRAGPRRDDAGQDAVRAPSRPLAQPVPLGVLAQLAGLDEPAAASAAGPPESTPGEGSASPDNSGKM
jgi:thioredoxin reductase